MTITIEEEEEDEEEEGYYQKNDPDEFDDDENDSVNPFDDLPPEDVEDWRNPPDWLL